MDSFIKRSPITGRKYDYFSEDTLRLLNWEQIFFYVDSGIIPLDVVLSKDRKDPEKNRIVFLFSKKECHEKYLEWINRKKNKEANDEKDIS